jgi:hypothetical protein
MKYHQNFHCSRKQIKGAFFCCVCYTSSDSKRDESYIREMNRSYAYSAACCELIKNNKLIIKLYSLQRKCNTYRRSITTQV